MRWVTRANGSYDLILILTVRRGVCHVLLLGWHGGAGFRVRIQNVLVDKGGIDRVWREVDRSSVKDGGEVGGIDGKGCWMVD